MNPRQQKAIVDRLVSQEIDKMKLSVTRNMMSVMLLVLKDKFDFTPDKLGLMMKESFEQFDLVNNNFVSIEDFFITLEELGLKVR